MNTIVSQVPIVGFAAYSGTGKTTLLTRLIPLLKQRHLNIAVIKHAHHEFDIDQPGKDSYKIRKSGANQMLIASRKRWALMVELDDQPEAPLQALINQLDTTSLDLILVEGFKHEAFPKIELHRAELGKNLLFPADPTVIAIATDLTPDKLSAFRDIKCLDINHPAHIADFICDNLIQSKTASENL